MTQSTTGILVKNLSSSPSLNANSSVLALTDVNNNTVELVKKNVLVSSLISPAADNLITSDEDGIYSKNIIGSLDNLETTDKTNIVSAINENTEAINDYILVPINTLETSGTITLADNSINKITLSGNTTFTLPTVTDDTVYHQILVQLSASSNYQVDLGTSHYFGNSLPIISTGQYDLIYEYDPTGLGWVCGVITKG